MREGGFRHSVSAVIGETEGSPRDAYRTLHGSRIRRSLALPGATFAAEPSSSSPAERLKKIEAEVAAAEATFRTAWGKQASRGR